MVNSGELTVNTRQQAMTGLFGERENNLNCKKEKKNSDMN